jgi:uncharacterized protein (DUF486 family)
MQTWALLVVSNVFMTFAWYGHLKNHKESSLPLVIVVSWGIAFFEYCFMIPANRLGSQAGFTTAQLKTMQEVVTLAVFIVFSLWYLGEPLKWNHLVGFLLIGLGAAFIFKPW